MPEWLSYCVCFLFRTVSGLYVSDTIKTRNFVTIYKILIHLGMQHTYFPPETKNWHNSTTKKKFLQSTRSKCLE